MLNKKALLERLRWHGFAVQVAYAALLSPTFFAVVSAVWLPPEPSELVGLVSLLDLLLVIPLGERLSVA